MIRRRLGQSFAGASHKKRTVRSRTVLCSSAINPLRAHLFAPEPKISVSACLQAKEPPDLERFPGIGQPIADNARRRRAPRSASPPNPASIMAQVEGSGTAAVNDPNSPPVSPLMPSVKKRVFGVPSLPLPPKTMDQRPPAVLPMLVPGLTSIEPTSASVTGLNALITSATPETKLKLPTRRSPPNLPKLIGAMATPHGEASSPPTIE